MVFKKSSDLLGRRPQVFKDVTSFSVKKSPHLFLKLETVCHSLDETCSRFLYSSGMSCPRTVVGNVMPSMRAQKIIGISI